MRKVLIVTLAFVLCISPLSLYAVGSQGAQYVGGTLAEIPKGQSYGKLVIGDANLEFAYVKEGWLTGRPASFVIPYASISDMEYGLMPSLRIGDAIGVALLCTPCAVVPLLIKQKRHFLTLEFTDSNNTRQAAVFEIGKTLSLTLLPSLEAKTNKKVVRQNDK
jgi:hypothetical protein